MTPKLLQGNLPDPEPDDLRESPDDIFSAFVVIGSIVLSILLLLCFIGKAHAETIEPERLANAIFKAEHSKTFPYGIMHHYKHTTPRQACLNTIRHRLEEWDGNGSFIEFLGQTYAPIGAGNDPGGLNRNWVRNVKYFYNVQ